MTVLNQVFFRHILQVLGDEVSPSMSCGEYLRLAADWFSAEHAWQFLRRPCALDLRASVSLLNASYVHGTRTLTKIGAFAEYTYVAGDYFEAEDGTGVTTSRYPVESVASADAIVLAAPGLGAAAIVADIDGRLPNRSMALPSDFMAFVGQRPLRSEGSAQRRIEFTSPEELTAFRAGSAEVDNQGAGFLAIVTEMVNEATEQTDPVIEHYPGSSENVAGAFRGYYRARLVIDPTSDTAVVPLPSGRPALELALIKAARAFALGLEEGEEVGKPSLEVLLAQLTSSDIWAAARKQDGLQQATVGPLRGGVGDRYGRGGRRMLDSQVESPS
jgi:hypothetical protein